MLRYQRLLGWVLLVLGLVSIAEARERSWHHAPSSLSFQHLPHLFQNQNAGWTPSLSTSNPFIVTLRGGSSPYKPPSKTLRTPWQKTSKQSFRKSPVQQDPFVKTDDDDLSTADPEDKAAVKEMIDSFLTRDSRNSFIARVYAILSGQLLFTALVCLLFGMFAPLTNAIKQIDPLTGHYTSPIVFLPLGGILLSTIAWFRMAAVPQARQKSPNKWWWLAIFTIGEALSLGSLSSLYKLQSVLLAMGATAIATISVSAYTVMQKNPNYDLSQWGATLSSWAMIMLTYLLLGLAQELGWLPFQLVPYTDMMYSVFASLLFSVFLAHHTKLIVGGKHAKYRMNEKDYVFGAMTLYVDIVNIFLNILQLIGQDRDS